MIRGQMTKRGGARRFAAIVALSGLLVAACSNSDSDDAADETSAPTTAAAAEPTDPPAEEAVDTTVAAEAEEEAADTTVAAEPAGPELGEFQPIEGVPGVSDEEISYAVVGTGPSNPLGYCLLECYAQGVQAYFDYRNSLGGVHGRELVIGATLDDEVANTQVKMLEAVDGDYLGIFSAPLIYAGYADVGNAGVPMYTTAPAAAEANGFESIFLITGTTCIDCPSRLNVQAALLAGATKVGSIGYGVSQASKDCVAGHRLAFERWGGAVGIEYVYANDELAFGLPNGLGPEVTAMKEAGVDFVLTCVDSNGALTLAQELERQGMGDVHITVPQGYGDPEFAAANGDLLEGDILSVFFRPFEANPGNSMIPVFQEWIEKGGYEVNDYSLTGWVNADLAVTGLLAAGPQFDRASIVEATNQISSYTARGMIAELDWTRQHNAPTQDDLVSNGPRNYCSAFVTIKGGKFELLGDADKPFFCFDPTIEEWVDATPTSFD